jgi:hypothetical protein
MSTPQPSQPKFRTWRIVLPVLLAAFGALMCAGPGSVAAPSTLSLFENVACPAGQHAGLPTVDAAANPSVQTVYCVDTAGGSPTLATSQFFGAAFGVYFLLLLVPLLALGLTVRFGPASVRALSPQGLEEIKRMIVAGRQVEAIGVVQKRLALSRRTARDYIQALADELQKTPAPPGIAAAPEVKQPLATVIERLRQLKELLEADLISDEEYDAKRFDILEAL